MFQSAPSITAGGFIDDYTNMAEAASFNPPPALLLGDSPWMNSVRLSGRVSIRPQHYCWGIRVAGDGVSDWDLVSIRPQHYCWGIPASYCGHCVPTSSFNPPPALLLGDSALSDLFLSVSRAFQSAPSITAGGFRGCA